MEKRFKSIKQHFDREAALFDKNFARFAPHYNDSIAAMVSAIPFPRTRPLRVADLGCGTGNIARAILDKYPRARVTCIDLSEKMIALASSKLAANPNVQFHVGDLRDFAFKGKYDVVVSSLVLHHFEGNDKKRFYARIFGHLARGGVFYTADITRGSNDSLQKMYMQQWITFMRRHCTPAEVKRIIRIHNREDKPQALMHELQLLSATGFRDIDVIFKWYYFSVYGGLK